MIEQLLVRDAHLSVFLSSLLPHSPFFDGLFAFFSISGLTIFIWILLLAILSNQKKTLHRTMVITFVVSYLATSFLVNIVLKNVTQRDRPWVALQIEAPICPSNYSFPSGHAAEAFAGATIFACFDKKRRFLYYGIAFLIAYSRVYLTCHYVLDILFGALIGYGISNLVIGSITRRKNPDASLSENP